jgi:sugar phosphate isomerase/epimerase
MCLEFYELLERNRLEERHMAMQFSLAHLTILDYAPSEATYIAAQAGYDFVSLRTIKMGLANEASHNYALSENKEMLRQTKKALAETGVKLLDIELARIYDGVDVKSYLPALEVAAELGGSNVISSIWTPNRSYSIERFIELCDLAKTFGLKINLEFVTFSDAVTLRDAVDVVRAAGRDNAGILVDMLHFSRSRVGLDELDAVPREWFNLAHLCDARGEIPTTKEGLIHTARDERFYVGEGDIDIAAIAARMPEIPYSIELPHLERTKELGPAEHARRCLETAKAYFASHPLDSLRKSGRPACCAAVTA